MAKERDSLQGEGTYTYDCGKHDCEYCRAMVVIEHEQSIARAPVKRKRPVAIIKQTPWPKYRASTAVKGVRGENM